MSKELRCQRCKALIGIIDDDLCQWVRPCVCAETDRQACIRNTSLISDLLGACKAWLSIMNDSYGVAGFHLSGNNAAWGEFEEFDTLQAAIAKAEEGGTP